MKKAKREIKRKMNDRIARLLFSVLIDSKLQPDEEEALWDEIDLHAKKAGMRRDDLMGEGFALTKSPISFHDISA